MIEWNIYINMKELTLHEVDFSLTYDIDEGKTTGNMYITCKEEVVEDD